MHEGDHTERRDVGVEAFIWFSYAGFSIQNHMTPNIETSDEGRNIWLESVLA